MSIRFVILNNSGDRVINITRAKEPLTQNWIASETASIGDLYDEAAGEFTRPAPPPVQLGTLETDKSVILADNEDAAEVTIQSGSTVHFVIDDEVHEVEPDDDVATLFVKANAPGPIRIEVENQRVMIVAQEVVV